MEEVSFRRLGLPAAGMALIVLACAALAAPQQSVSADAEAEHEKLERVRREIEKLQASLEDARREESGLLGELQRLDMSLDLQRRRLQVLEAEIVRCRDEIAARSLQAEELGRRVERNRRLLAGRLRALYVAGPASFERVALTAQSPGEVVEAYRIATRLSESDGRRIEALQADLSGLRSTLQTLENRRIELGSLRTREASRRRELQGIRTSRARLLADIRREAKDRAKVLREVEETERDLQRLIQALSAGADVPPEWKVGFERFRGLLPRPVPGAVLAPFGFRKSSKFDTRIPHPGVDLSVTVGEPIRAVFDGVTAFSDWFKGYGNLIILDHGGGFMSVYAHASERLVAQGDPVRGGDIIARGGETGSLEGPKLYFEILRNGKPEDPVPWLAKP